MCHLTLTRSGFVARLTGLFQRGGAYYIRVILPANHPLHDRYRSGKVIQTLGSCSHKEAVLKGTAKRAEILCGLKLTESEPAEPIIAVVPATTTCSPAPVLTLRNVFDRWAKAERRTADTLAACERALKLYEVTPACTQTPASETGSPRPVHRTQVLVLPAIGAR